MKKLFFILAILAYISLMFNIPAQEYKPVVKEDTSIWYFAHKQLAGNFIDTLWAKEKKNDWVSLYYHGIFNNEEIPYLGKAKESSSHEKIWYIPPEGTDSVLVFDIGLVKGDTFMFNGYPGIVDSTYYKNTRRYVEFNLSTDWGDKIKFIEGVGPNVSFIYFWEYNYRFLTPYIVCKYHDNTLVYNVDNPYYFTGCKLNNTGIPHKKCNQTIQLFPNPFHNFLTIRGAMEYKIILNILDLQGKLIFQTLLEGKEKMINMAMLEKGFYIAKIINITNNESYHLKIVKR